MIQLQRFSGQRALFWIGYIAGTQIGRRLPVHRLVGFQSAPCVSIPESEYNLRRSRVALWRRWPGPIGALPFASKVGACLKRKLIY